MNVSRVCTCLAALWLSFNATERTSAVEAQARPRKVALQLATGRVTAEVYEPATQQPKSAVVVLHGAGGTLFDGPEMRRVARHLAAAGHAVYVLHYFDVTGSFFATDGSMQKNFPKWLETVRASIPAIQAQRGDRSKIGIYGYSLGGFLALLAASDNPDVAAVVVQAGGVWNSEFQRLGKLPPVLMIHGEQDARVPFAKYAKPLISELRERGIRVETRFFPREGHVFSPEARGEVRAAVAGFFERRTGQPSRGGNLKQVRSER